MFFGSIRAESVSVDGGVAAPAAVGREVFCSLFGAFCAPLCLRFADLDFAIVTVESGIQKAAGLKYLGSRATAGKAVKLSVAEKRLWARR